MNKLMMALAVMTLGMTAVAQDAPLDRKDRPRMTAEERASARTQRMAKDLGLSADQLAGVEALNWKYAQQGEASRAMDAQERAARRAEMKERKAAYEKELRTLLTPEQFKAWEAKKDALKAKHRDQRMERRENGKGSLEQQK